MSVQKRMAARRGLAADAGLAVAFVVALMFTAGAIATSWGARYWPFDFLTGAVACAIALARRRHLAWASVAGLAVAAVTILAGWYGHLPREPGPAMALALAVLVGSALRSLPAHQAAAIAASGLMVVVGSTVTALPWSSGLPTIPTLNLGTWFVGVAGGLSLRWLDARRLANVEQVRQAERLALARELHDLVAHHVTGMVVQSQGARLIARKDPERLDACLADIETAGTDALTAMRMVVGILRDTADATPATSAPERLRALVDRFAREDRAMHVELADSEPTWPPEVASTVYRIVQEALTNISRHATQATAVTVRVAQDREAVMIEVTDDAPASTTLSHRRTGYGLVGMCERVEALGGTLIAGPRRDGGWRVHATVPVPATRSPAIVHTAERGR